MLLLRVGRVGRGVGTWLSSSAHLIDSLPGVLGGIWHLRLLQTSFLVLIEFEARLHIGSALTRAVVGCATRVR